MNAGQLHLVYVYGEDTPHRDDVPFKVHIVVARDEEAARRLVPSEFRIDVVDFSSEPTAAWEEPAYICHFAYPTPRAFALATH